MINTLALELGGGGEREKKSFNFDIFVNVTQTYLSPKIMEKQDFTYLTHRDY